MNPLPASIRSVALILLLSESAHASVCLGLVEERVKRDAKITAILKDDSKIASRYYGIRDSNLLLSDDDSIRAVAANDLRAVEFRDHSLPRLLYVAGGFFLGMVVGAALYEDDEPSNPDGDWGSGAIVYGAMIGTLVGLACPIKIPYTRRVECE